MCASDNSDECMPDEPGMFDEECALDRPPKMLDEECVSDQPEMSDQEFVVPDGLQPIDDEGDPTQPEMLHDSN